MWLVGSVNGRPRLIPGNDLNGFSLFENTPVGSKIYTLRWVTFNAAVSINQFVCVSVSPKGFSLIENTPVGSKIYAQVGYIQSCCLFKSFRLYILLSVRKNGFSMFVNTPVGSKIYTLRWVTFNAAVSKD